MLDLLSYSCNSFVSSSDLWLKERRRRDHDRVPLAIKENTSNFNTIRLQVMGRHERLHQTLGQIQRAMGGPGAPNADPAMEHQFNIWFKKKMAAEIVVLVRRGHLYEI